jgi:sulfur-oxidizing protein SoxZ
VITIRALISHVMENGQRRDSSGEIIPRRIINRFTCEFEGETVFACDLDTAIAANPYFEFNAKGARKRHLPLRVAR